MSNEQILVMNNKRQKGVSKRKLDEIKRTREKALEKIARQKEINSAFDISDVVLKNPRPSNRHSAYRKGQQ